MTHGALFTVYVAVMFAVLPAGTADGAAADCTPSGLRCASDSNVYCIGGQERCVRLQPKLSIGLGPLSIGLGPLSISLGGSRDCSHRECTPGFRAQPTFDGMCKCLAVVEQPQCCCQKPLPCGPGEVCTPGGVFCETDCSQCPSPLAAQPPPPSPPQPVVTAATPQDPPPPPPQITAAAPETPPPPPPPPPLLPPQITAAAPETPPPPPPSPPLLPPQITAAAPEKAPPPPPRMTTAAPKKSPPPPKQCGPCTLLCAAGKACKCVGGENKCLSQPQQPQPQQPQRCCAPGCANCPPGYTTSAGCRRCPKVTPPLDPHCCCNIDGYCQPDCNTCPAPPVFTEGSGNPVPVGGGATDPARNPRPTGRKQILRKKPSPKKKLTWRKLPKACGGKCATMKPKRRPPPQLPRKAGVPQTDRPHVMGR